MAFSAAWLVSFFTFPGTVTLHDLVLAYASLSQGFTSRSPLRAMHAQECITVAVQKSWSPAPRLQNVISSRQALLTWQQPAVQVRLSSEVTLMHVAKRLHAKPRKAQGIQHFSPAPLSHP